MGGRRRRALPALAALALPLPPCWVGAADCPQDAAAAEDFFSRFVTPLSPALFFERHWGRGPVLLEGRSAGGQRRSYGHLFALDELELLVAPNSSSPKRLLPGQPLLYFKHLRVDLRSVQFGAAQPTEELPKEGEPVTWQLASRLRGMLGRGATLVIGKAYSYWRPILDFVMALERYFEVRVHGNIYITGAGHTGRPIHSDHHGAFVVQLSGRKRWRVWQPFVQDMLFKKDAKGAKGDVGVIARDRRERGKWMAAQPLLLDATLRPGDVLYLPRGFLHEASAPGKQEAGDGASVHLTVSPEVDCWAELLEAVPFLRIAGQPPPPGRAEFLPSEGAFMPREGFEREASYGGTPRSLRELLPVRLSRRCGDEAFRSLLLQRLRDLDPSVPAGRLEERFEAYGKDLAAAGHGGDAIRDLCLAFVALRRRDLLSEGTSAPKRSAVAWDGPWCVQSPVAVRVLPAWLTPPGLKAKKNQTYIVHSRMNGPSRYDHLDSKLALPFTVPAAFGELLVASLHAETNPSGVLQPRELLKSVAASERKTLRGVLKRLLALDVLRPVSGDGARGEL